MSHKSSRAVMIGLILVGGFLLARSKDEEPTPPDGPADPAGPEQP